MAGHHDYVSGHMLHRSESGVREDRLDRSAWHYASELARYITSASTIRMHVFERFRCLFPIAGIEELQAARRAERELFRQASDALGERASDHQDFEVKQVGDWGFTIAADDDLRLIVEEDFAEPVLAKPRPVLPNEIIEAICRDFGVSVETLMSGTRKARIMLTRRTAMYVLVQRGNSMPQAAARLGLKDHTSVLHGVREFEMSATPEMREIAARYVVRGAA